MIRNFITQLKYNMGSNYRRFQILMLLLHSVLIAKILACMDNLINAILKDIAQ
ncbi:MAG: hypothetical protein ACTS8P_03145 [Arsenophonus sp. NC-XBC3-MAG3]